jgi:hypothetical protein
MRSSTLLLAAVVVIAALLAPAPASAVTVDEIVALSRAGVTEAVILAVIDRDKTIFTLAPDQLVALKSQGVSEPVILAMLKSGRDEGDRAAQAASDLQTAMYLAERSPGPEVVVIGHGPDTPNGGPSSGFYSTPPAAGYFAVPYFGGGRRARGRIAPPPFLPYTTTFPSAFQQPVVPPVNAPVIPPVSPTQAAPRKR